MHKSPQREDLHREKISSRQHREVSPNEFGPGGRALALRRWWYAATAQNIADRLIRDHVAQIGQSPDNPVIAPAPFFLGHANDQFLDFSVDWRSARGSTGAPSNLRATSLRYHPKMVSGPAAVATSPSALRPSRRPISPSVARSPSESLRRPFNCPSGSDFRQPSTHWARAILDPRSR
jgi:hypothetical protein